MNVIALHLVFARHRVNIINNNTCNLFIRYLWTFYYNNTFNDKNHLIWKLNLLVLLNGS